MRKTSRGVRKFGFPAFEFKPGLAKIFLGWPLIRTCPWPILLMMASTSPQRGVARRGLLAYEIVLGPTTTQREEFNLPLISGHLKAWNLVSSFLHVLPTPENLSGWTHSLGMDLLLLPDYLTIFFEIPAFPPDLETS